MRKYLWVDTETTGLDPKINAPHQVSGEIVIDGVSVDSFNLKFRPRENAIIEKEALAVSGLTVEDLMARSMSSKEAYTAFNSILTKYVKKFDKQDKMIFCAYNAGFDAQMINEWYAGHGNKFFFALCFGGAYFDPLQLALIYEIKMNRRIFQPDRKLVTIAKHFGLSTEGAHDALADIAMTRKVAITLWKLITS